MRKWCWRRPARTPPTRRFPNSSCKPNSSPIAARCSRRAASASPPSRSSGWRIVSALEGEAVGGLQFETDRARFLGRGHDLAQCGLDRGCPAAVRIPPARCSILCSRSAPRARRARRNRTRRLLDRCRREPRARRWRWPTNTATWRRSTGPKRWRGPRPQVQLRYLGVDFDEAQPISAHCQSGAVLRFVAAGPARSSGENQIGAPLLWPIGISGDLPIVLVRIDDDEATLRSSNNCCARMNTGGSSAWRWISSS